MLSLRAVIFTLLLTATPLLSSVIPDLSECKGQKTISTYIGKDKNVRVEVVQCDGIPLTPPSEILPRQVNVCGAQCNTNCFTPSGGGPDPNECHVITDALLYDSQNVGASFTMNPAQNTSVITMQYRSCKTFIVNQAGMPLTYCRSDWSAILDFVAFNCQSEENAHGGNCVAADQWWFIQVQSA
ncbi:hypothetical protein BDY19DRAFT_84228 [Irpex rosettiformis]|uniref:Uncharacterized protein n=1 Tax=Irpex rosettiformis TaxID=378272 RepID=A0ACB8U6I2_9APHY|nr:hypothetical protein BDY19DRAFT_84228 [Irpex rosettiformis]